MSEYYKYKPCDCFEKIAHNKGFAWKNIWDHQKNSGLRKKRKEHIYVTKGDKIFIPDKEEKSDSCATEVRHRFRRKGFPFKREPFEIILENQKDLAIPEAEYIATFADGCKMNGRLDKNGRAVIENPPPGEVIVAFPDLDDVEAKSLAACLRKAFDERDSDEIFRVMEHSPEMLKDVAGAYDKYFNDYTGKGFIEDIYQEIVHPDALDAMEGLLAKAGLPTHSNIEYHAWNPDEEFEDE